MKILARVRWDQEQAIDPAHKDDQRLKYPSYSHSLESDVTAVGQYQAEITSAAVSTKVIGMSP